MASWGPLWVGLGPSWGAPGPSWRPFWASWRPLGPSWGLLGAVLGAMGCSGAILEASLASLGRSLGGNPCLFGPSRRPAWRQGLSVILRVIFGRLGGPLARLALSAAALRACGDVDNDDGVANAGAETDRADDDDSVLAWAMT
eukprot:5933184-Pyramimonas_sp.AAC.1